jgi:hypothetical protein
MAVIESSTTGALTEVGSNTKALRIQARPNDIGVLGSYVLDAFSGTMAAGLAGNSPIFSVRWRDTTRAMVVENFGLWARNITTAFSAGNTLFELYIARAFTATDTGGGAVAFTATKSQARRTSMGATIITAGDMRISSTATLTAGTRTKDTNPISRLRGFVPATAISYPMVSKNATVIPGASTVSFVCEPVDMIEIEPFRWPVVFVQDEGMVLEATVPATGTWEFGIHMEWSEVATTDGYN